MAASSFLFYADLQNRTLSTSVGGQGFRFPTLTAGEDLAFGIRFTQTFGGQTTQIYPTIHAIRAAIGRSDTPPTGGTWKLSVDGHGPTEELAYNITPASLQTAINGISGLGVTASVIKDGVSYVITFSDGASHSLSASFVALDPSCVVRIRAASNGSRIEHELTLLQAPVAATDTFASVVAPPPSVTRIQAGSTDSSGQFKYPEIQDLFIPPNFQGTFALTYNGQRTTTLSDQSGTSDIAAALNALWNGTGQTVSVSNPRTSVAEITFDGAALIGGSQPLLGVVILSSPPGDPTCTLTLDTAGTYELLRSADSDRTCYLEIEADLVNPDSTIQTVTLCRQQVVIQRSVNWSGLEAATPIDWAVPVGPSSYLPFSPNQLITGSQYYATALGDGENLNYVITHGLGTTDLHLTLQDSSTRRFLVNGTDYTAVATSSNVVTVTFPTAPATGSRRAVISTAGPTSAFVSNLTITASQVTGLATTIENLQNTVAQVQELLPNNTLLATSSGEQTQPIMKIPLTRALEVIGMSPAPTAPADGFSATSLSPLAPSLSVASNFDRVLWSIPMSGSIFALGRTLQVDWGIQLQAVRANCLLQYTLVVETGTYLQASGNLTAVNWNTSAPVVELPVALAPEQVVHSFGLTLQRTSTGILCNQQLYGNTVQNNAAFSALAGDFAVRCRLIDLDPEDVSDPRGWIALAVVPSLTASQPTFAGGSPATTAQASVY